MNVRQKLSLAALCFTLPAMASAQAAPAPEAAPAAPAAAPAPAPAAAPAPAFSITPYGFLLLTANQQNATFALAEYPSKISSEYGTFNHFSARQSRIGFNMKGADGGFLSTKSLTGRLEFDFVGGRASYDSAVPRLRYAVATATWGVGPGTLTAMVGQTDGLVNALHPELGAYIAYPTFLHAGNLTRRSPQIRLGYGFSAGMVDASVEAAVLSSVDAGGVEVSAGNANGTPDIEARLQVAVKPMADVKATVAVGYHTNTRMYENAITAAEDTLTSSLVGVEANIDATKYLTVKGEWFQGTASDASQGGAWADVTGSGETTKANDTNGFWVQATIKPIPQAWIIAGYGSTTLVGEGATKDQVRTMSNFGVISPVSKNWKLGLEYSTVTFDNGGTTDISGNEIALSSRFTF